MVENYYCIISTCCLICYILYEVGRRLSQSPIIYIGIIICIAAIVLNIISFFYIAKNKAKREIIKLALTSIFLILILLLMLTNK